jgi:hypothetical protein
MESARVLVEERLGHEPTTACIVKPCAVTLINNVAHVVFSTGLKVGRRLATCISMSHNFDRRNGVQIRACGNRVTSSVQVVVLRGDDRKAGSVPDGIKTVIFLSNGCNSIPHKLLHWAPSQIPCHLFIGPYQWRLSCLRATSPQPVQFRDVCMPEALVTSLLLIPAQHHSPGLYLR